MSTNRTISKIITIKDKDKYSSIMQASEDVTLTELSSALVSTIVGDLKNTLHSKLPNIEKNPPTHQSPAYLAANQIGWNKRMVLLYLPANKNKSAEEIMMFNPTYKLMDASAITKTNPQFHINTFFAEQIRFRNDCYSSQLFVSFLNQYGNKKELVLEGAAAKAAQMGINFVYGITPLDFKITTQELLAFANQALNAQINSKDKLITTKNAYIYNNRQAEINDKDSQFLSDQIPYIKDYVSCREKYPLMYDPGTGSKKETEMNENRNDSVLLKNAFN